MQSVASPASVPWVGIDGLFRSLLTPNLLILCNGIAASLAGLSCRSLWSTMGCGLYSTWNIIISLIFLLFFFFPFDRDEVRAPIPQKQEILVEPEPLFGGRLVFLFCFFVFFTLRWAKWQKKNRTCWMWRKHCMYFYSCFFPCCNSAAM